MQVRAGRDNRQDIDKKRAWSRGWQQVTEPFCTDKSKESFSEGTSTDASDSDDSTDEAAEHNVALLHGMGPIGLQTLF